MEFFDVIDENGNPTGAIISRDEAHDKGILHRSVHIWVIREQNGMTEVLLQKRSDNKESFPGMFDTSSAGHVSAGEDAVNSAVREMKEELGIVATSDQLQRIGTIHIHYEKIFHGKLYRDNELAEVYVYSGPAEEITLQASEVSEVRWFDPDEVWEEILSGNRRRFCVPTEGLRLLRKYLEEKNTITIQTERLILKTNCTIVDGEIVLPEKKHFESILDIEPTIAEDFGFAIYLKSGELVGHIAFDSKRSRFELSVGIEEKYQKSGYMSEAQRVVVPWIFENSNTEKIWALLGGITDEASRKILERTGFKCVPEGKQEWWVIKRE